MKVFWAIIGLLLIGAVAMLLWTDRGMSSPKAVPTGGPAAVTRTPNEPLPEPGERNPGKDTRVLVKPEPAPEAKPDAKPEAKPETKTETKPAETKPTEGKPEAPSTSAPSEVKPAESKPTETKPTDAKPAESSVLENKPVDPAAGKQENPLAAPEAAPLPAVKIEKKDDGSMVLDGRFTVKGAGTPEDPYILPWDLFTSVEEVYKPQQGKKDLPGRIMMFDGKFVRIAGYVAYPMFVDQPRELLSMINQWDGCCIGVPPTPYDAIEVKLAKVVTAKERLATYGTVEGKLGVKPYLAGDWLVGLYLMEDAKLSVKEYNVGS
ncbi:MAG: hypothetical protein U0638_03785 [Phycisphaerales bacterium]